MTLTENTENMCVVCKKIVILLTQLIDREKRKKKDKKNCQNGGWKI
jgi:hypothetical protein